MNSLVMLKGIIRKITKLTFTKLWTLLHFHMDVKLRRFYMRKACRKFAVEKKLITANIRLRQVTERFSDKNDKNISKKCINSLNPKSHLNSI
jgi:EAL domain-containing protein (putative c-di-GMP-specific phosphodiesterase class I)